MIPSMFDRPSGVGALLGPGDIATPTAGYSLRYLSINYFGQPVIRVRKDVVGNPEQDFTPSQLTDGTLATFLGANDGFVSKWYDQFGSNDATQASASAQPKIWDASTGLVTENGKPAIDFDGSNNSLVYAGNFLGGSAGSGFSVSKFDNTTRAQREIIYGLQDATGNRYDFLITRQSSAAPGSITVNAIDFYIEGDYEGSSHTITDTLQHLLFVEYKNAEKRNIYDNGSIASTLSNFNLGNLDDGTDFIIGDDINTGATIDGKIQEIIIYDTDQSANRTAIETNINDHYNIY